MQQQVFEIFQGDAKVLPVRVVYQGSYLPVDLTNCQQIIAQLPLAAGGFTALTLTSGAVVISGASPTLGQFEISISSAISALLLTGLLQDIFTQLIITSGTNISISDGVVTNAQYCITNLGNTTQLQWQAIGLPSSVTAAVGVTFIASITGAGSGTGVVQVIAENSPMTVAFRQSFSVFE